MIRSALDPDSDSPALRVTPLPRQAPRNVLETFDEVRCQAASVWDVPIAEVFGRSRLHRYVEPRSASLVLLREITGLGRVTIGILTGRSRSTVLHSYRAHRNWYDTDPAYRARYERLRVLLGLPPTSDAH